MEEFCLIISGGELSGIPEELRRPACVIACDRGWQHAAALGIKPDLAVGDFDSSPLPDASVPVHQFPSRKDDTDTMLAARRALDMGFQSIVIGCAFGGRLDHTLANLQTAAFLAARGAGVRLLGKDTEAFAFTGRTRILPRKAGWSLSVFALSDTCEGVSIRGAKYECEKISLTNAFPLGVSNVWDGPAASITVEKGILLVLCSKLSEGEHI